MHSRLAVAVTCAVVIASDIATAAPPADQEATRKSEVVVKALERGRSFKQRGQFKQAWEQFEIARQLAPENSPHRQEAEQELNYHLPLKEIQHRVNLGDFDGAEQLLSELLSINNSIPARKAELTTMLENLNVMRSGGVVRWMSIDHNAVVRHVRRILEDYRRARGRYPVGYRELNDALPPNRPPLQHFLVGRYEGTGAGYLMVLRSKYDVKQVVTIQQTGILR